MALLILRFTVLTQKADESETKVVLPSKYEVVVECQRISSQATNPDWGYKSCLEELEESFRPEPTLLETI